MTRCDGPASTCSCPVCLAARETLPERRIDFAYARAASDLPPEREQAVRAAEERVVSAWRHLIDEGVMHEPGLRTMARTAAREAFAVWDAQVAASTSKDGET